MAYKDDPLYRTQLIKQHEPVFRVARAPASTSAAGHFILAPADLLKLVDLLDFK
jgi:hypothetical protein